MKKQLSGILLFALLTGSLSCTVGGYVETRPAEVIYTRPIAPGPGYIWIDGDWIWGGGRYTWRQGYWSRPRPGHQWRTGHWDHGGRGWRWTQGGWR